MKNQTIKLTESRLRKLVEACVKEALEETLDEGIGWEVVKNQINDPDNGKYTSSWEDFKEFTKGVPDKDEYGKSMDLYKAAKDGEHKTDPYYHAARALGTKPGIGGKIHRAGVYGASSLINGGKKAMNKAKKSFKKEKPNDDGSFTL